MKNLSRQIITLWLAGYLAAKKNTAAAELLQNSAQRRTVVWDSVRSMLTERLTNEAASRALQEEYPLAEEDITQMDKANSFVWLAHVWIAHRVPKFFMAFRDITNATNERTSIFSFVPFSAGGQQCSTFDIPVERSLALDLLVGEFE